MKAFLFDLDGTLLPLDTYQFLQKYLEILSFKMADKFEPEVFVPKLLESTKEMVLNLEDKTNEEVFIGHFFKNITDNPKEIKEIMDRFNAFYENDFKKLKAFTSPNPQAVEIIDYLNKKGYIVVLATNPVFPLIAITERLNWIGLSEKHFKFITSYEVMKYCKPQIQYYKQILQYIKIDPDECMMVGNDVKEDIISKKIGIKTFLVEDYLIDDKEISIEPDLRGTFKDLYSYIMQNY